MTILKEQVAALLDRRNDYATAEAYYEGQVPEVFATAQLRKAYYRVGYSSRLNFCRPVVDAVFNRLEINAVYGSNDEARKVINETWDRNELDLDADEIHRRTLVFGDCYVMVWPDDDGNADISYNTPLTTNLVYDPENPRKKLYAVKMWKHDKDTTRLNVYYPDHIAKYSAKTSEVTLTDQINWSQIGTVDNPFGEVPVFHFRTERPFGRPEHFDAFDAQNYINKQFITSMYIADYQGAPQRYALSKMDSHGELADFDDQGADRENASALRNEPGSLWDLTGYDRVGEFKPANPDVFWGPIKDTVRSMASLTNTPLHYFEKTGNIPSGQALRVAEAPLIKKVERRKASFGQSWRDVFKFVLKINSIAGDVFIKWRDIESLDELERLDAGLKKRNIGMSIAQVMREAGYDQKTIDHVLEEAVKERDEGLVGYQAAPNTRVQPNNDANSVDSKANPTSATANVPVPDNQN